MNVLTLRKDYEAHGLTLRKGRWKVMARVSNTTKTANKNAKTVKKTQKTTKKSLENEKTNKKVDTELPKVKVKKTTLGRPPRMTSKKLIAAAYEYMESAELPNITEFALQQGYEREYLYQRAKIEEDKGKPELSYTLKRISQLKEIKLEKFAMMGLCPPNFAIFALKQLGWTDKVEEKIDAEVDHSGGVVMLAPRLEDK